MASGEWENGMSDANGIKSYRDLLVWQKGMSLATELSYCHDPEASQCAAMIAELRKMLATLRRKIADRMSN